MIGADAMVKCLMQEGVSTVFGYPGVAICPFFNSLLSSDINRILVRTEQNAAHAANGYARVSGKVGVCIATSGPGATNLITGIATAYADSIPLICITGQVDSALLGSDVFQEADITGAAESFVKYSYLIKDVNDIPRIFKEAFYIASTGRKGPVLIDVPMDIQNEVINKFKYPQEVSLRSYKPTIKGHAVQINKVFKELSKAKRPIICAGGGVLLSGGKELLREFSHQYGIPVVSTMMGIGVMSTDDPLYFGMVGNNGKAYANLAMNDSDLLLMIGARVADRAISQPDLIIENKVLIHIDVDPCEIGKNVGPHIPLVGDISSILEDFKQHTLDVDYTGWVNELSFRKAEYHSGRVIDENYIDPGNFIKMLSEQLPDNSVYVADVGQNQMWSCNYHHVKNGFFLTSGGMGTMGYSIPAALGAKLADENRTVVAVCGDGSFQMSMMELATIRQHKINVKIIIFHNGYLGLVREYQDRRYKSSYSMVNLDGSPDIKKIAEAYGISYVRMDKSCNMEETVSEFLHQDGTSIMECIIDPYCFAK